MSALFQHAEYEKQEELRREAEKLEWERQRKEKKYNEACKKVEKQMLDELKKQSTDLMQSRELLAYIDEVKNLANKQYKDTNYPVELTDWINWAESYATEVNPLNKGLPEYKKAMDIVKLEDIE